MATLSVDQMREHVMEAYKGQSWRDKVAKMPDSQVIRLYYSFNERGKNNGNNRPHRPRKPRREKRRDRCEQLSFDDI